jgi:hypothetical protein
VSNGTGVPVATPNGDAHEQQQQQQQQQQQDGASGANQVAKDGAQEGQAGAEAEAEARPTDVKQLLLRKVSASSASSARDSSTGRPSGSGDGGLAGLLLKPKTLQRADSDPKAKAAGLLSPQALVAGAAEPSSGGAEGASSTNSSRRRSIDRTQLKQAMLELLEDEGFLDSLWDSLNRKGWESQAGGGKSNG